MPNWCTNKMTIRGPEEKLDELFDKVARNDDGELKVLESLWPMPEALHGTQSPTKYDPADPVHQELLARYGALNWYDWANSPQGWGTKWGDCRTEMVERSEGEAMLWFETAWAPPVAGVVNISTQWEELAFCVEYSEPGMGFAGELMIQGGRVIAGREWEVNLYDEVEALEDEEAGTVVVPAPGADEPPF